MNPVEGTLTQQQRDYGDKHMRWDFLRWQLKRDPDIVDNLSKGDTLALLHHFRAGKKRGRLSKLHKALKKAVAMIPTPSDPVAHNAAVRTASHSSHCVCSAERPASVAANDIDSHE